MKDKNFIQDALNTIKIEGNAVLALRDQINDDFERDTNFIKLHVMEIINWSK